MRVSYRLWWVASVSCAWASVGVALAGDCASGDAPSAYVSAPCDGGSPADWCTRAGGVVTCDVFGSGSSPITVYGVSTYSFGGADFALYGSDDAGNSFCCSFRETSAEIARIEVTGDPDTNDTLWLQSADGANWIKDPGGVQALTLKVYGAGGADDTNPAGH